MTRTIDYYFTSISPFSYLGHRAIEAVAAKHGAALAIKPVNLGGVWAQSGGVPLAQRSPMRQRYRLIELQRAADWRDLPIKLNPAHFPVDATLADHTVIAVVGAGGDASAYLDTVYRAIWAEDRNIADADVLAELLTAAGCDAAAVLDRAHCDAVAAIRARNTEEAIAADALGAPTYVVDGEPFWGQDRIELLDRMLESGRAPFTVPQA